MIHGVFADGRPFITGLIFIPYVDDSGRLHPAAIEANAAWAAGHYAADPDPVLETVLRAAGPIAELPDRDRRFRRAPATVEL